MQKHERKILFTPQNLVLGGKLFSQSIFHLSVNIFQDLVNEGLEPFKVEHNVARVYYKPWLQPNSC